MALTVLAPGSCQTRLQVNPTSGGEGKILIQAIPNQRMPLLLFLGVVTAVYATALTVVSRLSSIESAGVVVIGLTIDMVILVPLAFYFLLVRRAGHSIFRLAPVVVASLLVASIVLPSGHQRTLHFLEAIVVPAELGLLGWIIWRAGRALREARRSVALDPLEQFRSAAFGLLRNNRAAGVFASEIGIFYYALGAWRSVPHDLAGTAAFTHHRRSGQAGIVLGFVVLLAVEGFAVHLLLSMWNSAAAWLFTLSSAYGALWMVADYRATVLRPILVGEKRVLIRSGLRYTMDVSRSEISEICSKQPEFGKESLNLKLIGPPTHWIIFSEAVYVQGPYGTCRRVRAVGIQPDEAHELELALVSVNG
ncbi:MAG: hypothetical protein ABFS42_11775 [Candidatus Krumholzibacteriota bacterium]